MFIRLCASIWCILCVATGTLLTSSLDALGFLTLAIDCFAPATLEVQRLLGHGSSGTVYAVQQLDLASELVVKVHSTSASCEHEVHILRMIAASFSPHSAATEQATAEVHAADLSSLGIIATVPSVVSHGTLSFSMTPLAHQFHGQSIAATTDGSLLSRSFRFRHLSQLVRLLYHLHEVVGVFHRDVRPSNVMLSNNDAVLIDFDAALSTKPSSPQGRYRGAISHASRCVLQKLAMGNEAIHFTAADDLESLVLTTYSFVSPHRIRDVARGRDEREIASLMMLFWEDALSPPIWQAAVTAARKCEYDVVISVLEQILS